MAESLSEVSSSVEGLEATEDGKKKSKFKALKNFFGKKKKKESEDILEERMPKSTMPGVPGVSMSMSSLKPVPETESVESKSKNILGNKAISHDSVFSLESELEKSTRPLGPSPEYQKHRIQQKSISRTLPRSVGADILSGLGASVGQYTPRSGVWVAGSKITEIPPLRPHKPNISPPVIRSEKISKDFEKLFVEDKVTMSPKKSSSSCHPLTSRKSISEPSSESDQSLSSSSSSSQQPLNFSTPTTVPRCLDSSAAQYKMTLNPQTQKKKKKKKKKKKAVGTTVKLKQEEPQLPVVSKEKASTKPKQADQREKKRDNMGPSSREQSSKTESQEMRAKDQYPSIDVAMSTERSVSGGNIRRRRRKARNEWGIIERRLLQSTQGLTVSSKVKFSPTEKMTSEERCLMQLLTEKQVTGKFTTPEAEITTSQELCSDKGDIKRKRADCEAKTAPGPQPVPQDVGESMVSGSPPHHEEEASGANKRKDRASLMPRVERSTTQEEAIVSRTTEAQLHKHPSHIHLEEEEPSSPGLHKFQSSMELALDVPSMYKEKHPKNVFQTFPTSASAVTSTTAEGEVSMKRWPLRNLIQSYTELKSSEASSDSKSTSEFESNSEVQVVPGHSSQPMWKPKDKEVFLKTGSLDTDLSNTEQQQPLGYSSQFLGKPKSKEVSSEPQSSSEEWKSSEEVISSHSTQSLKESEDNSELREAIVASVSEEQMAPRSCSQALQDFEEKEVSTKSSSYIKKYNNSEDMSNSEGDQTLEHPKEPCGQLKVHQEIPSVSKSSPKRWSVSGMMEPSRLPSPPIVSPTIPQQVPTSESPDHIVKSWNSPNSEYEAFANPESMANDWNVFLQPLPPRKTTRHQMRRKAEQDISNPDITTMEEVVSVEVLPPRHHSQPPSRPIFEQITSAVSECAIGEESSVTQPPRYPPQLSVRPKIKKEVSLGVESATFEGSASMEPPSSKCHPQYQVSASDRGVSGDPRPPVDLVQSWMKPQAKQPLSSFPESIAVEGDNSMKSLPSNLTQPMMQSKAYQSMSSEYEGIAAKVISVDPLHSRYSSKPLPNPQAQEISEITSVEDPALMEQLSPSQHLVKTKFQPQMTRDSVTTYAQWDSPVEPISTQHIFQQQDNPKFKQVSTDTESSEAEENISMQPVPPKCPSQSWLTPTLEQISESPEKASSMGDIPIDPLPPRIPSKSSMGSVIKQPVSEKSMNASAQQGSSVELRSPGFPSQPRGNPAFMEQVSEDPESYVEEDMSVKLKPHRHHSQPPMSSEVKEVVPGLMRASGEWSDPMGPMPSKYASHLWVGPEFEQQPFSNAEDVATEGGISREVQLSRHPSQTIVKHNVHNISSSFDSSAIEGDISWKPLPPKCPNPFLRSKVQEMSSHLESTVAQEDSLKKPLHTRAPSQTFVKFMAEQIFSESPPEEAAIYAKPVRRSRPPKSLVKPKHEELIFLSHWDDDSKGDIPLENLPMVNPFQSSGRLEEPEEVLSYSESFPVRWSSSKGQVPVEELSQPLEMFDYRQEASLSVSYPEDWGIPEEQLPSPQPSQALNVSELQPPMLSAGPLNVPVEWSNSEEHLIPSQSTQAFRITKYKQQVSPSSTGTTTEETTSEKSSDSWPKPKNSVSPKNTKEHSKVSEDFIMSTPTSTIKPGKYVTVPTQNSPISRDPHVKDKVLNSGDGNKSPSILTISKIDVENIFGVQLRTIFPQRTEKGYNYEKSEDLTESPSVSFGPILSLTGKEQTMRKGALKGICGSSEKFSPAPSFAEKEQNRFRPEGILKKQGVYRPPGNFCGPRSDYTTTEPSWISRAKQGYGQKPRSRAQARAETKEPRCEVAYELTLQALQKELEALPSSFPSSSHAQEFQQTRLPKPKKSVAFQDEMILHSRTWRKETRRSLNIPPRVQQPEEPVWFSIAKKKAKAWRQMAEIMQ